jgi:hypothetical protein
MLASGDMTAYTLASLRILRLLRVGEIKESKVDRTVFRH